VPVEVSTYLRDMHTSMNFVFRGSSVQAVLRILDLPHVASGAVERLLVWSMLVQLCWSQGVCLTAAPEFSLSLLMI